MSATRINQAVDQILVVQQERGIPVLHLAITSSVSGSTLKTYEYNGSSYVEDPDVRIFIRKTGDPAPTGLLQNDIVLEESS